jgi:hypothetical protein
VAISRDTSQANVEIEGYSRAVVEGGCETANDHELDTSIAERLQRIFKLH